MKFFKTFLVLVSIGALGFTSCQKDPDSNELDFKYVVQTERDPDANFGTYDTYFVNDTVYVIGGSGQNDTEKWDYEESARARGMIDQVVTNMNERGYTRVLRPADGSTPNSDLAIQLVYVQNSFRFVRLGYRSWWDYWGGSWGSGWFWGGFYPRYRFPIVRTISTGSMIVDMADNLAPAEQIEGEQKPTKPIIWNAYATGLLSASNQFNQQVAEWSINQAFEQSGYISAQ